MFRSAQRAVRNDAFNSSVLSYISVFNLQNVNLNLSWEKSRILVGASLTWFSSSLPPRTSWDHFWSSCRFCCKSAAERWPADLWPADPEHTEPPGAANRRKLDFTFLHSEDPHHPELLVVSFVIWVVWFDKRTDDDLSACLFRIGSAKDCRVTSWPPWRPSCTDGSFSVARKNQ